MEFDFYDQFNKYSSIELLKIVRQPDGYQPEALTAAARILQEREVSADESEEVDRHFEQLRQREADKKQRVGVYKQQITDIIEPLVVPGTPVSTARWFRIFLVMYGLYCCWSFYGAVKEIVHFIQCRSCTGSFDQLFAIVNIAYLSILFYLLVKRKRWAWILVIVDRLYSVGYAITTAWMIYRMRDVFRMNFEGPLIILAVSVAVLLFFWRPSVAAIFGIEGPLKRRLALLAAGLAVILTALTIGLATLL